jgi:subtilase family serine protease
MRSARLLGSLSAIVTVGLTAAVAAGLPAAPAASAATAAPPGTNALQVAGATDHGVAAAAPRSVTLVLDQRDPAGLAQRLASHAAPLTSGQWLAQFAPSDASVTAVRSWATAQGLSVDRVPANRAYVVVSGSQAAMQSALGVTYHRFSTSSGSSYLATVGRAALPASVAAVTKSVLGLSSLAHASLPLARPSAVGGLNFPAEYGPKDIAALYDAPAAQTGAGQRVAVIAEGDVTGPKADLATFEAKYGLPTVPWTTIGVGAPSTDTTGDDEWDLDTQYSTGLAPDVSHLDVYDGPSLSDDDILATVNRWVSDDTDSQASFSAGECEVLADVSGFSAGLDTVLQQAAAQGQTLFTSSGDNGGYCSAIVGENGVPAGAPDVLYPAASPFAIGVGGTTVLGSGPNEIAWDAGGGGTSLFETTPAYQSAAGGSFTGLRRGVPDVSLDADPDSGYDVVVNGTVEVIGGTSASAPSWQGIWARAQAAHGGTLGFAGPVLYGVPASAFNDITLGTNGLFVATPGWDYTTGRGTPDIAKLVAGS